MRRISFTVLLAAVLVALVTGCSTPNSPQGTPGGGVSTSPGTGMMSGTGSGGNPGTGMMGGTPGSTSYSSLGQQIWLTGVGTDGQEIGHTAPRTSQGALMMGGGGCASCHGTDGRGGTISMMNGPTITAPDVTYAALIKTGFTDTTVARAIRDGLDEAGQPLKQDMPRWQMSDPDMSAVIAYVKQL